MDIFDIFLKGISYKFEKGYPDLSNEIDVLLIENELKNIGIDVKINEISLSATQLEKPFTKKSEYYGKYEDRGQRFLDKILNGEEFELNNGEKIKIDKNSSKDAINFLKNKNYKLISGRNKIISDINGNKYSLSDFKKTTEFGSGSGSGAGAAATSLAESTQCLFNALLYYVIDEFSDENLNESNYNKAFKYCDVTNSLEEMIEFSQDEAWRNTFIKTAEKLKQEFPNKSYKFHRGSSFVNSIYNAFKKTEGVQFNSDKWNPADIWMVSDNVKDYDFPNEIEALNLDILNLLESKDLIGISLKKIGNEATLKYYNVNDSGPSEIDTKIEDLMAKPTNKSGEVRYKDGKIVFRTFNFTTNFAGEIIGKTSAHGKIGAGPLNTLIKSNGCEELPQYSEIKNKLNSKDEEFLSKFKTKFSNIESSIDDLEFSKLIESQNIDWLLSKYMSVHILNCIKDKGEELLLDIINYASSLTKFSSAFVKIS